VAANTLDLARAHVKAIRDILSSDWYQELFPHHPTLRENNNRKAEKVQKSLARSDFFETIQGGAVKGIGLGGLITGFGAGRKRDYFGGCIICDDLLKEQDFNSLTQRNIVYDWFKGALCARRNTSSTPIVVIMQRLHPDDLVGRLLQEEPDRPIVKCCAYDEIEQKSVWETTLSTSYLMKMKNSEASIDRYMFSAKYQQEPILDLQSTIKSEWWKYYERIEDVFSEIHARIITMDTAYKIKTVNDESVIQLWGFDREGQNAYLLDMDHGRWEFPLLLQRTREFFIRNNYAINQKFIGKIFVEDKASGTSLAQTLRAEKLPASLWLPKENEPKDKMSRVLESSRYIASGRVFLPKHAPYARDFVCQCAEFTGDDSVHDDMVDAMTMAILIWRGAGAK
jgi:predicted phage terminase large subunit-like protein